MHRVLAHLGPLLALSPDRTRRRDDVERVWIVDGTLVPVRDRNIAASSKNYRFSANVQVVIDADSRLVVAVGRPQAGTRADAHVFRSCGVTGDINTARAVVLADGAYFGTGCIVPHRKRPGRPLMAIQEADNTAHRKIRARVEHAIARLKHRKILRDRRLRGDQLFHATRAIARMHNLTITG